MIAFPQGKAIFLRRVEKSCFISVCNPVRQEKPDFSIVMKREQHEN